MRMTRASLTDHEREYINKLIACWGARRSFRIKQCYRNAQRLIQGDSDKRLRYCEGYLNGTIPHAWLLINGKVVDVTAEARDRYIHRHRMENSDEDDTYFGFVIDRRTVRRHLLLSSEWSAVISRTVHFRSGSKARHRGMFVTRGTAKERGLKKSNK